MGNKKTKIIAFDLDGVVIGKPPLIPKNLIEFLYRGRINHKLSYRYPNSRLEIKIRKFSHFPYFRFPIKQNITLIKKLAKKNTLYVISSRYSFLEQETFRWLDHYKVKKYFKKIILNTKDEKPHLFKLDKLKKLKPDIFIEDDPLIVNYLKSKKIRCKTIHFIRSTSDLNVLL
ncbi:hypothetical protein JXA63_04575 [Candidatus Woesebacteria bacterium]|nr:hypothetical protein [Candidatus Woesebacteria bacterium]